MLNVNSDVERPWVIYGLWSAEGDSCTIKLRGEPQEGSIFAFENMGAYVSGLPFQFEPSRGLETRFIGENL